MFKILGLIPTSDTKLMKEEGEGKRGGERKRGEKENE